MKDRIIFYREWYEAISELLDEQQLKLYQAIMLYAFEGQEPTEKTVKVITAPIRRQIDIDDERIARISKVRSDAGKRHKGNQYTKMEQMSQNGTKWNKMEQMEQMSQNAHNEHKINKIDATDNNKMEQMFQEKENFPRTPLKVKDNIIEEEKENMLMHIKEKEKSEQLIAFEGWLAKNCPYIYQNLKPMSEQCLLKLKQEYGSKAIADMCCQIENRKDLRKTYVDLYRTLLNWLKREYGNNKTNDSKKRAEDAASIIARRLAEDDEQIRQ